MIKILIAEDDYDMRTIMADLFAAKGFEIVTAGDGEEALEVAMREQPKLIIMDVSMPKMDGFTMVRKLRQTPEIAKIPVIACTAHALKGDAEKTLEAGCDAYISKPFLAEDLVKEIQKLLKLPVE